MRLTAIRIGCCLAGAALAQGAEPGGKIQPIARGVRIEPQRIAGCELVNSRLVISSDWIDYTPGGMRGEWQWMWDAFDGTSPDPNTGQPTDSAPGCRSSIPVGGRWHLGEEYHAPSTSNDVRYAVPGAVCDGAFVTWFWGAGGANTSEHCFIALLTFESVGCDGDAGTGPLGGVVYDLGNLASNIGNPGAPSYFMGADLGGTLLRHQLPVDGFGGFHLIFGRAYDPQSGELTLATLAQSMLWGTGDSESLPDGRVGSDNDGQFHDPSGECYSYSFGTCPDPLCPAVGFSAQTGDPCPCPGDLVRDGQIGIGDLAILLSVFGRSGANIPNPCLDLDGNGVIDLQDLAEMLARFGTPC